MIDELQRRAAPMRLGILAVTASNAAEAYYISGLGTEALTVFGKLLPLMLMFDAAGIGLGAGASSIYTRHQRSPRVQWAVAMNSVLLALLITVSAGFVLWWARVSLFLLLGLDGESARLAETYFRASLVGSVFLVANMTVYALLRASNRSRAAAFGMVAGAVFNGLSAPLFMHGLLGLPALGLSGAAIAQALGGALVSGVLLLMSLAGRQIGLNKARLALGDMSRICKHILQVAIPATVANVMMPLGAFLVVRLLSVYGEQHVAAYGIAVRLEALCLLAFYAYSSVAGPVFGERILSRPPSELVEPLRQCRALCLKRGAFLALILLPLPLSFPLLMTCYSALPALTQYFWLVPFSYGAYGFVMIANASFNGIGIPLCGLGVSFIRCVGLLLPLAWLLGETAGANGVFLAISLSNCIAAVVAYRLLSRTLQTSIQPTFNVISPHQ